MSSESSATSPPKSLAQRSKTTTNATNTTAPHSKFHSTGTVSSNDNPSIASSPRIFQVSKASPGVGSLSVNAGSTGPKIVNVSKFASKATNTLAKQPTEDKQQQSAKMLSTNPKIDTKKKEKNPNEAGIQKVFRNYSGEFIYCPVPVAEGSCTRPHSRCENGTNCKIEFCRNMHYDPISREIISQSLQQRIEENIFGPLYDEISLLFYRNPDPNLANSIIWNELATIFPSKYAGANGMVDDAYQYTKKKFINMLLPQCKRHVITQPESITIMRNNKPTLYEQSLQIQQQYITVPFSFVFGKRVKIKPVSLIVMMVLIILMLRMMLNQKKVLNQLVKFLGNLVPIIIRLLENNQHHQHHQQMTPSCLHQGLVLAAFEVKHDLPIDFQLYKDVHPSTMTIHLTIILVQFGLLKVRMHNCVMD